MTATEEDLRKQYVEQKNELADATWQRIGPLSDDEIKQTLYNVVRFAALRGAIPLEEVVAASLYARRDVAAQNGNTPS